MTLSEVAKGRPKADSDYFAKERLLIIWTDSVSSYRSLRRKHTQHIVLSSKRAGHHWPVFFVRSHVFRGFNLPAEARRDIEHQKRAAY
jgi:hypothetical protein